MYNNDDKEQNGFATQNTNESGDVNNMNGEARSQSLEDTQSSEEQSTVYRYSKDYYEQNRDENNSFKINSEDYNSSYSSSDSYNNADSNSTASGDYNNTNNFGSQTYQYNQYSAGEQTQESPKEAKKRAKKLKKQQRKAGRKNTPAKVAAVAACIVAVAAVSVASTYVSLRVFDKKGSDDVLIQSTNTGNYNKGAEDINKMTSTSTGNSTVVTTDVSSMVSEVMPCVVTISNVGTESYSTFFGQSQTYEYTSSGSGIIVGKNDSELLIVTNAHVISGADTINVKFVDGKEYVANVKGSDSKIDIAVIAISLNDVDSDTKEKIKIATLGNSDNLTVGEPAIAIGNAMGYGQSVTTGVISAVNREVTVDNVTSTLIQTDAAINPGNSGGALLNLAGEVIGINSVKYTSTEVEGMGYAIPISDVADVINEMMNNETKKKVDSENSGYLGIKAMEITSSVASQYNMPEGIYVADVDKDGAADKAGIDKGDIITKIGGVTVSSADELTSELEYYEAGSEVEIVVQKQVKNSYGYEEKTLKVTLDKRPE